MAWCHRAGLTQICVVLLYHDECMIINFLPIILYVEKIKSLQFLMWFYHDIQTPIWHYRFVCEAIVFCFRYWVSEVFTSGEVSLSNIVMIKSPRYTGGDFVFLYRFVRHRRCRHRRRRPQILVHAITFEQLFGFLSFLTRLLALTCRLPD